jgi:uncharacterized protein
MSTEQTPVIINADALNTPELPIAESNCACPDYAEANNRQSIHPEPALRYQTPTLHTAPLADHYFLAFNPVGRRGVTVLNRPAATLLQAFQNPLPLAEGVRRAGNPPQGMAAAARLVEVDLLQSPEQPTPARILSPDTLTAWVHVTNDCNLRCHYCYVDKTPDKMAVETGKAAIAAVFRSAIMHNFGRVKLKYAGGEATLNFPLVVELQRYAQTLALQHNLGLEGVVLSNGVSIGRRTIQTLAELDLRLMISLDGISEDHDRQRPLLNGSGSFQHVARTLDRLATYAIKPAISITVSQRNLAGLPRVVEDVLQREMPFTLNFYRENDCSSSFTDLAYDEDEMIAAIRAAFAVIEANLPPYKLLDRLVDLAQFSAPHQHTCGVGHAYMVIDQRGGIAKCHMEIERTVTDIYAADPLQLIRADQIGIQNLPVEEKEGCRECTWRYWCAGGCPALTYRFTKRFDIKSPNCRIYKAIYPDLLRLEAKRLLKYGLAKTM